MSASSSTPPPSSSESAASPALDAASSASNESRAAVAAEATKSAPERTAAVGETRHRIVLEESEHARPPLSRRLYAVWFRHWLVYRSTLLANSLPAFAEPIFFLIAIGIGLGQYIDAEIGGLPFGAWLGAGVLAMTALFTSVFETTYGTFVRMVYQKTYDAMIVTPITVRDAFLGELLWCGTKGLAFTAIVLSIFLIFGAFNDWLPAIQWTVVFIPFLGFVAGFLFGALGMLITSRIKNLNNFNFFLTGVITPMAFFSGMLFPVQQLPFLFEYLAYALPLFHFTELNRYLLFGYQEGRIVEWLWFCPVYLAVVTPLLAWVAIRAIRTRVQA